MIEHIKKSLENANLEKSKLNNKTFEVPGFTSPKIRHLLNNLGNYPNLNYLEIGVHKGATFVASNFENNLNSSIAVDNWSEFAQDGLSKQEFVKFTNELLNKDKFTFYEKNCFELTENEIKNKINFYLYDGAHDIESHYKSLQYFYKFLDDEFIFIVDDWNWEDPRKGTFQAIKDLNLKTIYLTELDVGWHNGLLLSLLKK